MPAVTGQVVDPAFEPIRNLLQRFGDQLHGYRAQVACYVEGELAFNLAIGSELGTTHLLGIYSTTKGIAASVIGLLVSDGALAFDDPVAQHWPEFGEAGKSHITVRQLLNHQAGLLGVRGGFELTDFVDSRPAAKRLAALEPVWKPGQAFGYHALTIGILMEEIVRRVTGSTLQEIYRERVRDPHAIDCYLGLPPVEEGRFRPVLFEDGFRGADEHASIDSLESLANNDSNVSPHTFPNLAEIRAAGPASVGAIASAEGIARAYSIMFLGDQPLLAPSVVVQYTREDVWGVDRVLLAPMSYTLGFMKPSPRIQFGGHSAFGHEGAGGSLGMVDPDFGYAFAYIPQRREEGGSTGRAAQLARLTQKLVAATDPPRERSRPRLAERSGSVSPSTA